MRAPLLLLALLLGQDDPARRAEALVRKLGSETVEERDAAIRGLFALGKAALPAIEKAAADGDVEIAARARNLLRRFAVRDSISPKVRAILPGIEDRLDPEHPSPWTEALLKLVERREGKLFHPEIRAEDLDPLAALALRGAEAERPYVVQEIRRWGLRSAAAELLPLLNEGEFNARFWASQTLKALEAREIVPKVLPLLRHSDALVRSMAIQILVDWNVRESAPALVEILAEGGSGDRGGAAEALIRFRAVEQVPPLVARLDKTPPGPFQDVVRVLTALQSAEAVPKLLVLLRSDNPILRRTAAGAFSVLKVPEAVPELGKLLEHEDEFTRTTASLALEAIRTPQSAEQLVRHGLGNKNPWLRTLAFSPLCNLGFREAIPDVIRALRDENLQIREGALYTLEFLDAREAIPEIVRLLYQEKTPSVLIKAIQTLVGLRAREALPALEKLIARPEFNIGQAAIHALGDLGSKAQAPTILKAMEDPLTRGAAVQAAGRLGLQEASARITEMLSKERNFGSQLEEGTALLALGAPEAVSKLLRIVSGADPGFRRVSEEWRVRLNDRSFVPVCVEELKGGNQTRQGEVVDYLRDLQATEATPALAALLDNPDKMVRGNALMAIAGVRGREAIPECAKRLRDSEYYVRMMALWALRDLDARSATPDLLRQVEEDEELGMSAADLLAEWGVRDVLFAIRRRTEGGYSAPRPQVTGIRFFLGEKALLPEVLKGIEWGEKWVAHRMIGLAESQNLKEAVPALRSRLNAPEPEIQLAASAALIRLGSRDGVDFLLDQHRGWTLLNCLRRPEEFQRLDAVKVSGALVGTARQIAQRIAKDAGLDLAGPPAEWADDPTWDRDVHRIINVGDRLTRLQILEQVLAYRFEFLCDPGGIRIVRRGDALQFWRAWRADERRK